MESIKTKDVACAYVFLKLLWSLEMAGKRTRVKSKRIVIEDNECFVKGCEGKLKPTNEVMKSIRHVKGENLLMPKRRWVCESCGTPIWRGDSTALTT